MSETIRFTKTCRDLTGMTFKRLTVVRFSHRGESKQLFWECLCSCGKTTFVISAHLNKGICRSCGCYAAERSSEVHYKHGHSRSPIYKLWHAMLSRCHTVESKNYKQYGARGISVCQRWRDSFENFLADMGPRPSPAYSIDRIDNNKGYEPENCRWATLKTQQRNTSRNHFLTYAGETLTISEWAERMKFDPRVIQCRLKRGWTSERSVTSPLLSSGAKKKVQHSN